MAPASPRPLGWRGGRRSCMPTCRSVFDPLRRLQGEQAATTFSQLVIPPRDRGSTWSKVRSPLALQYWQQNSSLQKKIEARECHALLGFHEFLQHHDRRYPELLPLAVHHMVIFRHDLHPVQHGGLDRLLPGPKRLRG